MSRTERDRRVERILAGILLLNLLVASAKAAVGYFFGSLAVASDAIHSFLDSASNVVGLFAMRIASSPPDREHPYGHGKVEIVAAVSVGLLIASASIGVAWRAVSALISGTVETRPDLLAFAVMGGTLIVNVAIASWERARGRELNSRFLLADAAHTTSDVLVTLGVLVSLTLTRFGLAWADPVASLIVTLVIARVGWNIVAPNVQVLIDRAAVDEERVRALAASVPGVIGCHRIRSRGIAGAVHLDLHLVVDAEVSLRRAHEVSHQVEAKLKAELAEVTDVTIHVEPEGEEAD
jgi:cation diffusion facilitator family transporter